MAAAPAAARAEVSHQGRGAADERPTGIPILELLAARGFRT